MEKTENNIFGWVYRPASTTSLLTALIRDADTQKGCVRMWRGQENIAWPLHSTAYRRLQRDKKNITERDVSYYETSLLDHATHRGFRQSNRGSLSDLELLALLQHHGAATRLIDFTRNALVALWFAVRSSPEDDGVLIGVHTDGLGGYEGLPNFKPYKDYFEQLATLHASHPQTWEPTAVSPRVAAQQSQFLFSPIGTQAHGSLALDASKYLVCYQIGTALKPSVRETLTRLFGVSHYSLFPDLEGFGYENSSRFGQYENSRW